MVVLEECMNKLCLVTYTRKNEVYTTHLDELALELYHIYGNGFKVIIYCEEFFDLPKKPYDIQLIKYHGTKYKKLLHLFSIDQSEYFISIDNDITPNTHDIKSFLEIMIKENYSIGWGKINVSKYSNVWELMVLIDKVLSHNIIRPTLWKLNTGISIPGQFFCLKRSIFDSKLLNTDTYLDDLAIGLYVSKYIDKRYISDKILGSEAPNNTFMGLVLQRWRWGIGYSTLLLSIWDNSSYRRRLLIHGFAYHFLWIIIWFLCYIFFEINNILGLIYLGVISFIISKPKNLVFYSFIYEIIFPIFHIVWGISVINTIIRGRKHNECL